MTVQASAFSRRTAPEGLLETFALCKQRARGMPGVQCTRSLVRAIGSQVCARVFTAEAPETSGIPHAMVLTAYGVLSPATNSSCHRHRRIDDMSAPGWADTSPPT